MVAKDEIFGYRVVAFDRKWKFLGYIDPSLRDSVFWIHLEDAVSFILTNKPDDEYWLINVDTNEELDKLFPRYTPKKVTP